MRIHDQDWGVMQVIRAFFPFKLIIAHLKLNLISIIFWSLLFLMVFDRLGSNFGVPFLFLSPEYLGDVSPLSFLLMGFAIGGFIMGFNTYSYIKVGAHFPFLTTLAKPFLKFSINNGLIPLAFVICHISQFVHFQSNEELNSSSTIAIYVLTYLSGIALFMILSILYFFPMSRKDKSYQMHSDKPIQSVILRKGKWYSIFKKEKDHTYIYIGRYFRLMPSRSSKHFDQELVEKIFAKNRINASLYEILNISVFFILGLFNDYEYLEVPAASSIVLLLTICLMLFSALHSWLNEWVYPLIICTFIFMNYLSVKTGMFNYTSYAYGLNYDKSVNYSIDRLKAIQANTGLTEETKTDFLETLENWKKRTGEEKPKLVIVNTSGGGSRSALWTIVVLQEANRITQGQLLQNTQMITGASGGMIGAAFMRSLYLESLLGNIESPNDEAFQDNISSDILNKLSFMASTNDIFIRYQKHYVSNHSYTKDRGYAFERQLQKNTNNLFDHTLNYFTTFEKSGMIPTMIFTPTIVNDGRRMFISGQRMNFITNQNTSSISPTFTYENVDFHSLLNNQNTKEISFSSVLRASATFPMVMPMITLPTTPGIQLMDAGIRDNYGGKTTLQYLSALKEWITENTSGVIILQIRDTKKIIDNETYKQVSFMDKITLPFGNMYKNFPKVQSYNQDELMQFAQGNFSFPIDMVTFNLKEKVEDRISLSWHLTKQEKRKIGASVFTHGNHESLMQLQKLLSK